MKSESIKNLAIALCNFQGEIGSVPKNKSGVHSSKYADFEMIIEHSKSLLKSSGLSVTQLAYSDDDKIGVETILMHISGEWVSSKLSLPLKGANLAQAGGSIISYVKRYAYSAILGIATGEDNDGNTPQQDKQVYQQQQQEKVNPDVAKKREAYSLMKSLGLSDPDASLYAQNQIASGNSIDQFISHLTDFANGGFRWDIASKQFLQK